MDGTRKFGIVARLVAVLLVMLAGMGGLAAYTWQQLHEVADVAALAEKNRVPQLNDIAEMELNVTRVSLLLRHAMLARTPDEQKTALDDIETKRRLIDKALKDYEGRLFTDEGRQRFAPVPGLMQRFWETGEANVALITQGQKDEAFAALVDKTIPARNALLQVLDSTVDYQTSHLSHDIEHIRASVSATLAVLLGMFALIAAGLAAFAWWLRRTLLRRVAAARQVAERVRDGDLTGQLRDDAQDELSPLLAALAQMQAALVRVVSTVRGGAEGVATASTQIAQGSHDLSSRTEEQAGALQQTAATMEELGSTVEHNARHALEASRLAAEAAQVASQGGALMGDVVSTMEGISDSSRRIGDIIGVIDGIAFQTNLLALNAAVEAARAGDHGRGFAVVAGEVRGLASRSAEAAREIKSLIGASVERVERGTGLVGTAGSTMQEIVQSIGRVNEIVREISGATQEQSRGVTEVGRAVEQMDTATQQNAALVEESAAAAESMRQQAQRLVASVAVFRVAD